MYNSLCLIRYNSELLIKQSQLSTLTSFIVPLLTFFRDGGEIPFGCLDPHHLNKLNAYHPPTGISPFKGLFRFGHLPRRFWGFFWGLMFRVIPKCRHRLGMAESGTNHPDRWICQTCVQCCHLCSSSSDYWQCFSGSMNVWAVPTWRIGSQGVPC